MIDSILVLFVYFVLIKLLIFIIGYTYIAKVFVILSIFFFYPAYKIILHWKYGKTIGKYFMELQVLNNDNSKISFKTAVLREVGPLGIAFFYVFLAVIVSILYRNGIKIEKEFLLLLFSQKHIGYIFQLWFVIDCLVYFFNKNRLALHDIISSSMVVNAIADNRAGNTKGGCSLIK